MRVAGYLQVAEVALALLHQIGEGAPDDMLAAPSGRLARAVAGGRGLACSLHECVCEQITVLCLPDAYHSTLQIDYWRLKQLVM